MKKYPFLTLFLLLAVFALPAVAQQNAENESAGGQTSTKGSDSKESQKPQAATADPSYVIGPQDVLDISVWKEPELSRNVPVRPDGKISLPLLNDVQAAGLTPTQLGASITEMLRRFVNEPRVTVIVTAMNSQRVFVLGEVNRPGAIPLLPSMTVIQAIASSGGFTQFANQKRIYVLRAENGKQNRYPFNYKAAVRGDTTYNIELKPGDTIVVP